MQLKPYLLLMRPANIVTAIADIVAGASVAGVFTGQWDSRLVGLVIATIGLYGGGVVFNDIFDRELDAVERPERPLPSGQVTLQAAQILGGSLLIIGILTAFWVSTISGFLAVIVAILALLYDKIAKHHAVFGPLNMGLCRAFNLLLGISISSAALTSFWYLGLIPLLFIVDITLTSQGEVKGGNQSTIRFALVLDLLVVGLFLLLSYFTSFQLLSALPFLLLWFWMNSRAKWAAIKNNTPKTVQNAVKMGVLSLIPLNACLAGGFEGGVIGVLVLSLLPLSFGLARVFSVT